MSALVRIPDSSRTLRHFRNVPLSDSCTAAKAPTRSPRRHVREMLRIGHLDEAGTHAAAARPTMLPLRILHLRAAAHLHLSPDDAARENPPRGPRLWSLIVESESVYN